MKAPNLAGHHTARASNTSLEQLYRRCNSHLPCRLVRTMPPPRSTSEDEIHSTDDLPTSVRGAPPELRRVIRKRQNSESAKRCRQRKKLETVRAQQELVEHANNLARLENVVQLLARRIDATASVVAQLASAQRPPLPAPPRHPVPTPTSTTPSPPPPRPPQPTQQHAVYAAAQDDVAAIAAKVDELGTTSNNTWH